MNRNISRKAFIKGAAASALGLTSIGILGACSPAAGAPEQPSTPETSVAKTAWSWETAPEPITDFVKTVNADIVIVGSGLAGTIAACRAAELGASVAVIEQMDKPSSRGGHYAVYQTEKMKEAGIVNAPKEEILRDWIRQCGNRCNEKLVWKYLDRSEEAFAWLMGLSEGTLEFLPCVNRYVGETYYEYPGTHIARYSGDDNSQALSAPVFVALKNAQKNKAQFYFNTSAEQLRKDGDKVVGVVAKNAEGYIHFKAAKAVILATGDLSGDEEMVKCYGGDLANLPQANLYTPAGANKGMGHKMGMWAGGHMEMEPLPTMIHLIRYTMLCFAFLHLNQQGKRFMNEDTWIQAKSIRILNQGEGHNEFAYSVFDDNWREDVKNSLPYGGGQFWDNMVRLAGVEWTPESTEATIESAVKNGMAWKADTLEELAAAMGVDQKVLLAEVARYNELCRQGEDTEYHKRKELLTPIAKGPFYALKFGPAMLCMPGGLEINEACQVLDAQKNAIPGLYAIGNVSGGRYGVDYPVTINGNSHGSCITFGYLTANQIMGS